MVGHVQCLEGYWGRLTTNLVEQPGPLPFYAMYAVESYRAKQDLYRSSETLQCRRNQSGRSGNCLTNTCISAYLSSIHFTTTTPTK